MKGIFKVLFILICALNTSCVSKFSTVEMENNFSEQEINDLKLITDFFQNQICENKKNKFQKCFLEILPDLIEYGYQPIAKKINFEEQLYLYDSISNSTFNEIWDVQKSIYPDTGLELKSLGSKYKGRYQQFLFELGAANSEIKEYAENLEASGDWESMGILQQRIYKYPEKFDLKDPNIQLLIAIHFLTQNDQINRMDVWED